MAFSIDQNIQESQNFINKKYRTSYGSSGFGNAAKKGSSNGGGILKEVTSFG